MKSFIELEEAINILKEFRNMKTEKVELLNSLNRYLAEDVYSKINNPPFNKSAMDGYSIRVEDCLKENEITDLYKTNSKNDEKTSQSIEFKVVGELFAGGVFEKEFKENECIKIMTGAKIPNELNAVIKKEEVIINENKIILTRLPNINENICFIGEDIKQNDLLVEKYKKLNYADIGILSSSGINKIEVFKKPKIALLTTGDEVIDICEELQEAKIYNSNKYSILSRIFELGFECEIIKHIDDDLESISQEIKNISHKVDLIITTGGASVGDKDFIIKAIQNIKLSSNKNLEVGLNNDKNTEILFNKVKIKPGSAVIASNVNNCIIISLSGNPTASLTTFELLVKPLLENLSGGYGKFLDREVAFIDSDFTKKSNVRRFVRGRYYFEEGLQKVEITQIKSGNGILSSTLNSNCIVEIGTSTFKKNDKVQIIKL